MESKCQSFVTHTAFTHPVPVTLKVELALFQFSVQLGVTTLPTLKKTPSTQALRFFVAGE